MTRRAVLDLVLPVGLALLALNQVVASVVAAYGLTVLALYLPDKTAGTLRGR